MEKITDKILHIPPYLSTSWKQIETIQVKDKHILIVYLKSGSSVEIPNLSQELIKNIFETHEKILEQEISASSTNAPVSFSFPLPMMNTDSLFSTMQHSSAAANSPDLPKEVLQKIGSIIQTLGLDSDLLPQAEENCNCFHCQIARVLNPKSAKEEELVKDEELSFRLWDIEQKTDKLYIVKSPTEPDKQFQVFLGDPIGCTCGEKHCEHVKAVLQS